MKIMREFIRKAGFLFCCLPIIISAGCDSATGTADGDGYAPESVAGKTIVIKDFHEYWIFYSNSSCSLGFNSVWQRYNATTVGAPSCKYKVTGENTASLKLSYSYTRKYGSLNIDDKYSYTVGLTLTFTGSSVGTASGSITSTYVDYYKDKTTTGTNVVSDRTFAVTDKN